MNIGNRILLSRFLTRFGDQAFDFAVPLALLQLVPGKIQHIAFLYLLSKIVQILFSPKVQKLIDHLDRLKIYRLGMPL